MRDVLKNKKICILGGGWSEERHEVLKAAKYAHQILKENGFNCEVIEVKKGENFLPELYKFDYVLLSVTEEVPVQGALDIMGIPYSGSGVLPTSLSLNKKLVKELLTSSNLLTAPYVEVTNDNLKALLNKRTSSLSDITQDFTYPIIVKPNDLGSSVGVSLVKKAVELKPALLKTAQYSTSILIEKFIKGQEITIPVLNQEVLPVVSISTKNEIFDEETKINLTAKYSILKNQNLTVKKQINETVNKVKKLFNLKSIWRLDAIISENKLYILEINTLPYIGGPQGMMATSYTSIGLNYYDFLVKIVSNSINQTS